MNALQAICSVVDMPLTMEADVGQGKDLDVIRVGAVGTIANRFRKTIRDVVVSMPATLQKTRADQISGGRLSSFARLVVPFIRKTKHRYTLSPPLGSVHFGSLDRTQPISDEFGFDRGQPVDRLYIENFLAQQAGDIKGRVLEFGDRAYTRKFGGGKVTQSDVMDLKETNKRATIVGDLADASHIPSNIFDCIVCTQMLGFLYDVHAGMKTLHRILKPGGVLLLTGGGISRVGRYDWQHYGSYWRFTSLAIQRLLEECFPKSNLKVETFGNVYAAVAFLEGIAVEELDRRKLLERDIHYQVLIGARAVKEATI